MNKKKPRRSVILGLVLVAVACIFWMRSRSIVAKPSSAQISRSAWAQISERMRAPQPAQPVSESASESCTPFVNSLMALDLREDKADLKDLLRRFPAMKDCADIGVSKDLLEGMFSECSKNESMCPLVLFALRSKISLHREGGLRPIESETRLEILAHRIVSAFYGELKKEQMIELLRISKRMLELEPGLVEVKKVQLMAEVLLTTDQKKGDWDQIARDISGLTDADGNPDPDFKDAWIVTATHGLQLDRIPAVVAEWMRREPGSSGPYELLGYQAYKQGDRAQGIQYLKQAIQIEKDPGRLQFMKDTLVAAEKPGADASSYRLQMRIGFRPDQLFRRD